MNKKMVYLSGVSIIATLFIAGILFSVYNNRNYSAFVAIGCNASRYEQESGIGYLTVTYGNTGHERDIRIRVNDAALQNTLSETELENVIGVNLEFMVPFKILREQHIAVESFNLFEHLKNDTFDNYFVLLDVFYK